MTDDVLVMAETAHASVISALMESARRLDVWSVISIEAILSFPGGFALLAFESDAPVGFVLVRVVAGESELLSIGVVPSARRKGLGRRLVAGAMAEAAKRRATAMFLEVADDNDQAISLYRSSGFVILSRRRGYYRTTCERGSDAFVMRAVLDAE